MMKKRLGKTPSFSAVEETVFHVYGMTVEGQEGLFFGNYTDEEFSKISAALFDGLPAGWFCYHLSGPGDPRLPFLRQMPTVIMYSPIVCGNIRANPITELKRAGRLPQAFRL